MVHVPKKMLDRLLLSAEYDDSFARCEDCGAWFYIDETRVATADDVRGRWWAATRRAKDVDQCFRLEKYRMVGAYGTEMKGRQDKIG